MKSPEDWKEIFMKQSVNKYVIFVFMKKHFLCGLVKLHHHLKYKFFGCML